MFGARKVSKSCVGSGDVSVYSRKEHLEESVRGRLKQALSRRADATRRGAQDLHGLVGLDLSGISW